MVKALDGGGCEGLDGVGFEGLDNSGSTCNDCPSAMGNIRKKGCECATTLALKKGASVRGKKQGSGLAVVRV